MKKLLVMTLTTVALFAMMATTVSAHSISYSRYQDKHLDHYNQSGVHYHNISKYDTAYLDNYYYADTRYNDYVKHYVDYDMHLDLDTKYAVQPLVYDVYYDDYYIQKTFPRAVNYYFPPSYYYY